MRKSTTTCCLLIALLIALATRAGGGSYAAANSQTTAATPAAASGVSSLVLVAAPPAPVADGELALGRVTIDPGSTIPPHEHAGTQLATILSGELTYTVLTGSVAVRGADGADLVIAAGETVVLRPGDSLTEQPGAFHTARNNGAEQVVIMLATLFPAGAPRALYAEATPAP